jgi:hypothetical protein
MLRKSATPSLPGAKLMISMGVSAGVGGGSKTGKLFIPDDDGESGDDGHICNLFSF